VLTLTLDKTVGNGKNSPNMNEMTEAQFRRIMQSTLDGIERAFENIDPDVAECDQSLGSMTITFADRSRCILSAQPSVRQLWLALAAKGTAHHFNWDGTRWLDDKGKGIELLSFLEGYFRELTGQEFSLGDRNP
jgi:CyaY protein